MSKVAIMQPYLFPYIGYFQLMAYVDVFVIYDNLKYTKKGWINRNRILVNGKDEYLSIPLKNASDYLLIKERSLANSSAKDKVKTLNKIVGAYSKAPFFNETIPVIERCLANHDSNLFKFIFHSIVEFKKHLQIDTELAISSEIQIDHSLRSKDKVIAICKAMKMQHYVNPIGGTELYNKDEFAQEGIKLEFLKANNIEYAQLGNSFVPYLSIIDVLMFNGIANVKNLLRKEYTLH
ncbi:MAG: WbqC family protein [Bacteroidia bacterium]